MRLRLSQNAFFHFKNHIFANNSKTAGFRPFSSIFNPSNPILLPPDLAMTKFLWKFQTPTTPGAEIAFSSQNGPVNKLFCLAVVKYEVTPLPKCTFFISKITFLPITQKPLGFGHFRQFSWSRRAYNTYNMVEKCYMSCALLDHVTYYMQFSWS